MAPKRKRRPDDARVVNLVEFAAARAARRREPTKWMYRVVKGAPDLGLYAGDMIIHEPSDPVEPFTVHRNLAIDAQMAREFVESDNVQLLESY